MLANKAAPNTSLLMKPVKQSHTPASTTPTQNVKLVQPTLSPQVQNTQANGKVASVTATALKNGATELNTSVTGKKTKLTARAALSMLMATFMMDFGPMIKRTVSVFTATLMERCMMGSGGKIYNMGRGRRRGLMAVHTLVCMIRGESMVMVLIYGLMGRSIQESGGRIRSRVLVFISGLMADPLKVNGMKIIWKELEFILGQMVESIKECIETIRNTDMVFINGPMAAFTKATGTGVSSTDSAFTTCLKKTKSSMVYGRMENELNGLMSNKHKP